ncbi:MULTISPECIES: TFIIB-type zinc ribbon-containing protein [Pseudoalteromonas]|uniref:GTP-binding protein EngA n=1 Tax=Pseudoalteromonas fuliginea TaxID=1872678 RepID=A0A833AEA1_9GAMM|nr:MULTISPECIES: zf-TFIIB domain-containing protein [Pseudoalteromonas]ALQ10542.1 GTP-binding protein EngA [Pseudoalteromonas sp. Bsw20308]ATG79484.1 GTP-binding protein EngA [Pseudoalteromonas sp. 1_2015MBL_MicDiv]KAA1150853.1 GTP-binding protein EngA [Pseudoalteromonas fuliginea]KAA1157556.1 GTP-binding protein EngA [Pseudoalteromonas fuliginea]KAA1165526.1 GTP-binding protein EngA [Pseudoalteromonas fuliginea]
MHCPRTNASLEPLLIGGITVYTSAQGGVFFDNSQIFKFSSPELKHGQVLLKHLSEHSESEYDVSLRINCPKCKKIVMMRRYFSPVKAVEIDECPGCAGIWLDSGELAKIHENHLTPKERKLLAHEMATNHGFITIKSPTSRFTPTNKNKSAHETTVENLVRLALLSL